MILIIHIAIALTSVVYSTYSIFSPSQKKLERNYLFILATLISAGFLIWERHVSFGHACLSGLAYVALVSLNLTLTKRRLASSQA